MIEFITGKYSQLCQALMAAQTADDVAQKLTILSPLMTPEITPLQPPLSLTLSTGNDLLSSVTFRCVPFKSANGKNTSFPTAIFVSAGGTTTFQLGRFLVMQVEKLCSTGANYPGIAIYA